MESSNKFLLAVLFPFKFVGILILAVIGSVLWTLKIIFDLIERNIVFVGLNPEQRLLLEDLASHKRNIENAKSFLTRIYYDGDEGLKNSNRSLEDVYKVIKKEQDLLKKTERKCLFHHIRKWRIKTVWCIFKTTKAGPKCPAFTCLFF